MHGNSHLASSPSDIVPMLGIEPARQTDSLARPSIADGHGWPLKVGRPIR
jgi:hypothetical protein